MKDRRYQIGLATSTSEDTARRYLSMEGVADYFDVCIYGNMAEKSKPDPEIYIKAVEQLGRLPEECLVLEDSPNGVLAGFQAGCPVVMIPDIIQPDHTETQRTVKILPTLKEVICYLESQ